MERIDSTFSVIGNAFGPNCGWREGLTLADLEAAEDKVTFLNQLYVRILAAKEDDAVADEAQLWSRNRRRDSEARPLGKSLKMPASMNFIKSMICLASILTAGKAKHFSRR